MFVEEKNLRGARTSSNKKRAMNVDVAEISRDRFENRLISLTGFYFCSKRRTKLTSWLSCGCLRAVNSLGCEPVGSSWLNS